MANINKNELYNLICEYYGEKGKYVPTLWGRGYAMNDWANILGVSIAPATITSLVHEGLLVVEEGQVSGSRRIIRYYHKSYTPEERDARLAELKHQRKINDSKRIIKDYEDCKRRAHEIYEKSVADAEKCLKETLANYEQQYADAVAFLEENNEH